MRTMVAWKTVGVTALAPETAHATAAKTQHLVDRWWFEESNTKSVPLALLHQERTTDTGEVESRVTYGKLTVLGTVIPCGDESPGPDSGPESRRDVSLPNDQWRTVTISYLPYGVKQLDGDGDETGIVYSCLLLQEVKGDPSHRRVVLGKDEGGFVVPELDDTFSFDFGPWEYKGE